MHIIFFTAYVSSVEIDRVRAWGTSNPKTASSSIRERAGVLQSSG
jgi:hypothetical protein